jgi:outer membrane receptor protein involved in Fe transport
VVTASKREEDIQQVPSSVSVINDVELDNLHANQLTDYAPYVPGLQVNSLGTPGQVTIALRGLAPISSGSTVSTYIDEIPVGSSGLYQRASVFQLDLLPYDIRRVEILRGPQGTLYGANSLGGLLKYVTLDPSLSETEFRFGGGLSGVAESDDLGWDVHGGATFPLIKDQLGVRLSYARNELPGFIDNVVNGSKDINSSTQQSALVSFLYRPNDTISIELMALGQRIEADNSGAAPHFLQTGRSVSVSNWRFLYLRARGQCSICLSHAIKRETIHRPGGDSQHTGRAGNPEHIHRVRGIRERNLQLYGSFKSQCRPARLSQRAGFLRERD